VDRERGWVYRLRFWTATHLVETDMEDKQYRVVDIVAKTIDQINQDGEFVGNSNTGYRGDAPGFRSTKDRVIEYCNTPTGKQLNDDVWKEAFTIYTYFQNLIPKENENDFLHQLVEIFQSEEVDLKKVGFVVASVPTYRNKKAKAEIESEFANSTYVGIVGKRQNFFLKYMSKKFIPTAECYLYTFCDRHKNLIKSWVTIDKDEQYEFQTGDCIDMDAYVNKHEANKYNALRETVINRIKIIENKGQA
jgi:hypothetical protein